MTDLERTTPGISGNFNEDLPIEKVVKQLTKNPDGSGREVSIDLGVSLVDADPALSNELGDIGVNGELVTKIKSVGETFYIVRLRPQDHDIAPDKMGYEIFNSSSTYGRVAENSARRIVTLGEDAPLVLVYVNHKSQDQPVLTARGIHNEEPVHVGRQVPKELDHKAGRFDLSGNGAVSARHFNLVRHGNNVINLEVTSTNETEVSYAEITQLAQNESSREREIVGESAGRLADIALSGAVLAPQGSEVPGGANIELSVKDKLLEKMPILGQFQRDLDDIARMRKREEGEGSRYGMNQYDSSERMIDALVGLMAQVQKPKLGEDRRGAIYRYINLG